jgi:hypothetical protein
MSTVFFKNLRIFDGRSPVSAPSRVLVRQYDRQNRSRTIPVDPKAALIIDGGGRSIPGLISAHVHDGNASDAARADPYRHLSWPHARPEATLQGIYYRA